MLKTNKINSSVYLTDYIDKAIESFSSLVSKIYLFDDVKNKDNIHPGVKIIFMVSGVLVSSLVTSIKGQIFISSFIYLLIFISGVKIYDFFRLIFFPVFLFGLLLPIFSIFNFITNGEIIFNILNLKNELSILGIKISEIGITKEGIYIFFVLFLRVFNSISISFFVIITTGISRLFISMKFLNIPDFLITIFILCVKYIEVFSKVIMNMYLSRKSRVYKTNLKNERKWIFGIIVYLFKKSIKKQNDVFNAMISKGFSGEIKNRKLCKFNKIDYALIILFEFIFVLILCYDRH